MENPHRTTSSDLTPDTPPPSYSHVILDEYGTCSSITPHPMPSPHASEPIFEGTREDDETPLLQTENVHSVDVNLWEEEILEENEADHDEDNHTATECLHCIGVPLISIIIVVIIYVLATRRSQIFDHFSQSHNYS